MPRRIPARPTLYQGVGMRSRLEARFAAGFDKAGLSWVYEPNCFADATGQYLPDFRVGKRAPWWYVEVKPHDDDIDDVAARMEIIWASEPNATLIVLCGNGRTRIGRHGKWDEGDLGGMFIDLRYGGTAA